MCPFFVHDWSLFFMFNITPDVKRCCFLWPFFSWINCSKIYFHDELLMITMSAPARLFVCMTDKKGIKKSMHFVSFFLYDFFFIYYFFTKIFPYLKKDTLNLNCADMCRP